MMRNLSRIGIAVVFTLGLAACDSMEMSIDVSHAEEGWLEVINSNERVLKDVHLVVEAFESEGATRPCAEETIARWQPGASIRVPECAEKVRFTLTSGSETARFSYTKGRLYRRIGRKEVPISR